MAIGSLDDVSHRYYEYISDGKVDMLLAQVDPGFSSKRAGEVSFDLKVVGGKRSVERSGPDRYARLERVMRYLDDHGDVGTVDEPGQYFRGILPMAWGPMRTEEGSDLLYFGGRSERTIVGLGGSLHHHIGAQPTDCRGTMRSSMPVLLRGLVEGEDQVPHDDPEALGLVHRANARLGGVTQKLEFVAKRLLHGPSPYPELDGGNERWVLLGSPLYVAQAG
ncbi:DUF7019 family protein [Plantactinospora solaniradicis]|uniref:DUF7019 family protein n=1 Tax=Plantactinospora solaniradicis TaxID=1723736 RepID=A0ABW1KR87_9ACTN